MVERADVAHIIKRAIKRMVKNPLQRTEAERLLAGGSIDTYTQGNFTIVLLMNGRMIQGLGASKRMPDDDEDQIIGYNIALKRAVENALQTRILGGLVVSREPIKDVCIERIKMHDPLMDLS